MQTERARSEHRVLTVIVGQQRRSMGYSSYPSLQSALGLVVKTRLPIMVVTD